MRLIFFLLVAILLTTHAGNCQTSYLSYQQEPSLKAVKKKAKIEGKPILHVLTANWCRPCREFKKEVLENDSLFQKLSDDYIYYEADHENEKAFLKKINSFALPTFSVIDAKGKLIHQVAGYLKGSDFHKTISSWRNTKNLKYYRKNLRKNRKDTVFLAEYMDYIRPLGLFECKLFKAYMSEKKEFNEHACHIALHYYRCIKNANKLYGENYDFCQQFADSTYHIYWVNHMIEWDLHLSHDDYKFKNPPYLAFSLRLQEITGISDVERDSIYKFNLFGYMTRVIRNKKTTKMKMAWANSLIALFDFQLFNRIDSDELYEYVIKAIFIFKDPEKILRLKNKLVSLESMRLDPYYTELIAICFDQINEKEEAEKYIRRARSLKKKYGGVHEFVFDELRTAGLLRTQ